MTIDSEPLPPLATQEDQGGPLVSSKALLSDDFSELHGSTCKLVHSVRICLTANELLVAKRASEKSPRISLVRRHRLEDIHVSLHEVASNAMLVEVPNTVLRYIYQLENGGSVEEWLRSVLRCKDSLQSGGDRPTSKEYDTRHKVNGYLSAYARCKVADSEAIHKSHSSPSSPALPRRLCETERSKTPDITISCCSLELPPSGLKSMGVSSTSTSLCPVNGAMDSNRHFEALLSTSQNGEQLPRITRVGSERAITRRDVVKAKNYESYLKEREKPHSSSVSDISSLEERDDTPERFQQLIAGFLPPPSPTPDDEFFHCPHRHTQIRKGGKMKYSPRLHRFMSSDQSSAEGKQTLRESKEATTFPRRKKTRRGLSESTESEVVPRTAPSSPLPNKPAKSPKLLKIFHRRWQSSGGIKVHLIEDTTDYEAPNADNSPQKLHLLPTREVAEELSLMDAEMLRRISPDELENGAWMDKSKHELAPNVMAMVGSFNRLALLVPTEILQEKTPQMRAKVISAFIQLASKCYSLKNYNSLKAILAGLQCTPVYRLKKTWKEVPSKRRKRFTRLSQLMSEEENWKCYRKELERLLVSNTPCIPFLGLFLTQIVQKQSYVRMRCPEMKPRDEKDTCRRRSSSFDNHTNHRCVSDAKKLVWRDSTLSISAPTSPARSDFEDEEENGEEMLNIEQQCESKGAMCIPTRQTSIFTQQSSLATSESSLDSKCSMDDFLKHQRTLQPHSAPSTLKVLHSSTPQGARRRLLDSFTNQSSVDTVDSGEAGDEIDGMKMSLVEENDLLGGFQSPEVLTSSPRTEQRRSTSLPKSSSQDSLVGSPSELEISNIDFTLEKSSSRSAESLLDSYSVEDTSQYLFQSSLAESSRLSVSLQSIDSVFSNEDEFELSDCISDISLQQIQASLPSSVSVCQVAGNRGSYTEPNTPSHEHLLHSTSAVNIESNNHSNTHAHLKRMKRSKSYGSSAARTVLLRRKKNAAKVVADEEKLPSTPSDLLTKYQIASHGCCLGRESKAELRVVLTVCTYNSESQNYKLSFEREPL